MSNLKRIHKDKNPVFCVITPLLPGDKISKDTKITVKRNDYPFIWAAYESENNVAKNFKLGIQEIQQLRNVMFGIKKLPDFIIKVDNDTVWRRNTLDHMVDTLKEANENVAYSYVSFEYKGSINKAFPAVPFDSDKLRRMNYISSNSMFRTKILQEIPLVDDDKYKRLLDWAYYLKLLNNGYIGIPCERGYFVANSSSDSISSGSKEDFIKKYKRVVEDFI